MNWEMYFNVIMGIWTVSSVTVCVATTHKIVHGKKYADESVFLRITFVVVMTIIAPIAITMVLFEDQ